ncbi:MAG: type II toxin-antitoxin system HicB family antitoxin [Acidobacteriota bacterium]
MRDYAIIFGKTETGWSAYVPDLPGLIAAGSTLEETQQLMREGLEMHLGSMLEDGDAIPEPSTHVMTMRAAVLEHRLAKSA